MRGNSINDHDNIFLIECTPMLGKWFIFDVDIVIGGGIVPDKHICSMSKATRLM